MKTNAFSKLDGKELKIAVIASRFNQDITDALLAGCEAALAACGVTDRVVVRVPGSFELPQAAAEIARYGRHDAVVCLGCIIKGETDHDVFIAQSVAQGIQAASLEHETPIVFGVLTTRDKAQALSRVEGLGERNKGYEAGMSGVEMALLFRELRT